MNYIEVEHPHGFLIWRGKQKAIANDEIMPVDHEMLLVCNGEAYGKLKLAQPAAVILSEFDRLKDDHCIRPEERKMMWPGAKSLYIHRIASFEPFSGSMPVTIEDGQAEFIRQPSDLSRDEAKLVSQAEKLPKTIILSDDGLVMDYDTLTLTTTIDYSKALQAFEAAVSAKSINGRLPLYRLALIRQPHLIIERTPPADRGQPVTDEKKQVEIEIEGEDMPYEIESDIGDCSGYAVVKETDGRIMGCHETEEEAQAQLAALNIAESEDGKSLEAAEAAASDASVEAKFMSGDLLEQTLQKLRGAFGEQFNKEGPMDIWDIYMVDASDTFVIAEFSGTKYEIPYQEVNNKIVFAPRSEWSEVEMSYTRKSETDDKAGRRLRKTWRQKLQAAYDTIKEMLTWADYDEEDKILTGSTGFAIKQVNGQPWFTAWSTNAFRDREQEIFSTKSLEQYVNEAERLGDRGYFNVWHIPGTDFAKKKWQGVIGRILVESGPFLDNELGQAALKFFTEYPNNHPTLAPEGWGMSPEYRYLPEDRSDKIYDWLWITRSSVLARSVAANIYTKGGLTMALTDEQKQAAEQIFGTGLAAQIIQEAETESKKLEEAGIAHKDADPAGEAEQSAETQPELNLETVVAKLVKQLDLSEVVKTVETVAGQVAQIGQRLEKLEKGEKFKEQDEMPRYVLQLKRASEAEETKLPEGDTLREQKPKETTPTKDNSLAGQYFTPVK